MVNIERMNEVLEMVLGENELTPDLMNAMEELRTDYFTEPEDNSAELEELRTRNSEYESDNTALRAEIKRRFFENVEQNGVEVETPETKETESIKISDFSE